MSRADRAERDEILRRRTTPEQYDAVQEARAAEEAAAQQASDRTAK
jgi:hypothetical protein